jgi:hypothetical protein
MKNANCKILIDITELKSDIYTDLNNETKSIIYLKNSI